MTSDHGNRSLSAVVCDEQPIQAQAVACLLESAFPHLGCVGHVSSARALIELAASHTLELAVADLDAADSVATIVELLRLQPALRIVVLTRDDEPLDVATALGAGARGYLLKDRSFPDLADTIRAVMAGSTVVASELMVPVVRELEAFLVGQRGRDAKRYFVGNLVESIRRGRSLTEAGEASDAARPGASSTVPDL